MAAPIVDEYFPETTEQPKKRQKLGSQKEKKKVAALSSHSTGEDCKCTRLHCFQSTSQEERESLISHFNSLASKDSQDSFLAALIDVGEVERRRPTPGVADGAQNPHDFTYKYHVKVVRGVAPHDQRGKHANRPHAFSPDQVQTIINHICSFRGRQSHYSRKETRKFYLPEELNIAKMHRMFLDLHPNQNCCYESYRQIFEQKFNISFGYPRQDTCSECDSLAVKISHLDMENQQEELQKLEREKELHQRKASIFYERKRAAKEAARAVDSTIAAAAFDFWKNMPLPNITTNDVYYRRQLSQYFFDIHYLGANKVYLYSYDETVANKGSNDAVSLLNHFIENFVRPEATQLQLFCDFCADQNKNWTMFRYLYSLVHVKKRFENVMLSFPIRGHSYMECDKDTGMVNQKFRAEVPQDWISHFKEAQRNPQPFNVICPDLDDFKNFSHHFDPLFLAKCPVASRPFREVKFDRQGISLMSFRESWHGPFAESVITKRAKKQPKANTLQNLYSGRLPISEEKFKDLQVLKRFTSPAAQEFFDNLPHGRNAAIDEDEEESEPLNCLMARHKMT